MTDQLVSAIVNLLLALSFLFTEMAAQRAMPPPTPAPAAAADVPLPGSLCGLERGSP